MIRKHIQEGKLNEAKEKLLDFFELMKEIEQESILISSRIESLEHQKSLNTLLSNEKNVEENKLRMSTLFCCQRIEDNLLEYFPTLNFKSSFRPLKEQLELKLLKKYDEIGESFEGDTTIFFRAKEMGTGRLVMLRVFKGQRYSENEPAVIADKKIKKVLRIKHRNIIKVLDTDFDNSPRFLVLEYIRGVSLDHLIEKIPFSLNRAISLFRQLCDAVYYLHINGIVHGNIKPDKVLIDHELTPVISPFDIASSVKDNPSLNINELLYSAPELFKNVNKSPGFKSDQFSLGLLAYELFCGVSLFESTLENSDKNTVKFNAHKLFENRINFLKKTRRNALLGKLPGVVRKIISKMLAEEPEERYESLRDVKLALDKVNISSAQEVDIAMASYERCCIANPNFINEFYDELFQRSDHHKEIQGIFGATKIKEESTRRHKMLRVAIDLLIDGKREVENLKKVFALNIHKGVKQAYHQSFLKTIIKCVEKNDPLWCDTRSDESQMSVKEAWDEVEKSFGEIMGAE